MEERGVQRHLVVVNDDVVDRTGKGLEHRTDLSAASEERTEAEVRAVAEGKMGVRSAPQVEGVGVLEDGLVAVRRRVPPGDVSPSLKV